MWPDVLLRQVPHWCLVGNGVCDQLQPGEIKKHCPFRGDNQPQIASPRFPLQQLFFLSYSVHTNKNPNNTQPPLTESIYQG